MSLQPGCVREHKTEQEKRFPPDAPIETWQRECQRVTDCHDPAYNTEWACSPWVKVS